VDTGSHQENASNNKRFRANPPSLKLYARLNRDTPALRAGDQAKYEYVERLSAKALAGHEGLPDNDMSCRVTAATAIGKLATEAWLTKGGPKLEVVITDAFAALKEGGGSEHARGGKGEE